jgi:hypothetical protein
MQYQHMQKWALLFYYETYFMYVEEGKPIFKKLT